jgi:hypothetical protein
MVTKRLVLKDIQADPTILGLGHLLPLRGGAQTSTVATALPGESSQGRRRKPCRHQGGHEQGTGEGSRVESFQAHLQGNSMLLGNQRQGGMGGRRRERSPRAHRLAVGGARGWPVSLPQHSHHASGRCEVSCRFDAVSLPGSYDASNARMMRPRS